MRLHSITAFPVINGMHQCRLCKCLVPPDRVYSVSKQQTCVLRNEPTEPKHQIVFINHAYYVNTVQSKGKGRGKRIKPHQKWGTFPYRIPR